MERIALPQNFGQKLASIQLQKQSLAPAVLKQDRAALKKWEQLDGEAAALRRQAELEELAASEAKKLAAQAEAEAQARDRQRRLEAATHEAQIIVDCDRHIDAMLVKLKEMFERRVQAARALALTRVVSSHATLRLQSKFNPTSAALAAGLRDYLSLEPVLPAHIRTLSDADAWLAKPLTIAADETPGDDDPGRQAMEINNGE